MGEGSGVGSDTGNLKGEGCFGLDTPNLDFVSGLSEV